MRLQQTIFPFSGNFSSETFNNRQALSNHNFYIVILPLFFRRGRTAERFASQLTYILAKV